MASTSARPPYPTVHRGTQPPANFGSLAPRGIRRLKGKTLVDNRSPPAGPPPSPVKYRPGEFDVTGGPTDRSLYAPRPTIAYGGGDPRSYQFSPFLNRDRIRYYEDVTYGSIYDANPDPQQDPTVGFPQAYDRVG